MTRRMHRLTVLALALALAGAFASTASAKEFHSEASSTVLTGTQLGTDVFTTTAGTIECENVSYLGSMTGTTNSTISVKPSYSECTAFGFAGATVSTNGCEYVLFAETLISFTNLNIECPEGKSIVVVAKLFGTTKCTVTIGTQTALFSTINKNAGSGTTRELRIGLNISSTLIYTEDGGTGFGACSSSTKQSNGSLSGELMLTGENALGNHIGVWHE